MCQLIFDEESISKISNSILINFERTHRWLDGRMEGRTDKPKAICPFNSFKVRGIKAVVSTKIKNQLFV